jgi:hypothetical protein
MVALMLMLASAISNRMYFCKRSIGRAVQFLMIPNGNGVFHEALCLVCQTIRTHHRCLAEGALGGRLLGSEGDQFVCGAPV